MSQYAVPTPGRSYRLIDARELIADCNPHDDGRSIILVSESLEDPKDYLLRASHSGGRPAVALVERRFYLAGPQQLAPSYHLTDFTIADLQELPS